MTQPTFNIFDALSAWGKTLPIWQHFLLSKLVAEVELLDEVLDEVFAEYLIDQKLAGPDAARIVWDMALPQFQAGAPVVASTLTAMTGVSGGRGALHGPAGARSASAARCSCPRARSLLASHRARCRRPPP
jgi:hypothetical protein